MSKITTIALVVVAMSLGVMAALYLARKKYNKMANINCTLPAGLETYLTKETGSGFPGDFGSGNHSIKDTRVVDDQWVTTAAGMHEFNFRNEHHHLLASLGNDSGYLGGGGVESGVNYSTDIMKERQLDCNMEASDVSDENLPQDGYIRKYEEELIKACPNTVLSSADSLVGSTEESEYQNNDLEDSPLNKFPHYNGGYIKQSTLQPWQTFNDQYDNTSELPTVPATTSGYITIQNLNSNLLKPSPLSESTTNNNGYVLQQDLQNLFHKTENVDNSEQNHKKENTSQFSSGDGYTTLENLSKLNLSTSLVLHNESQQQLNQTEGVSDVDNGGDVKTGNISGYVTQHDLNLFAQFQQNH